MMYNNLIISVIRRNIHVISIGTSLSVRIRRIRRNGVRNRIIGRGCTRMRLLWLCSGINRCCHVASNV